MNPLTDEVLERAKVCDSKHYEVTNAFQPQYVVLALNPSNYDIVYTTDNSSQLFDLPKNIIGRNFLALLEESCINKLTQLLIEVGAQDKDDYERLPASISIASSGVVAGVLLYRNTDFIFVEIETDEFNIIKTDFLEQLFLRLAGAINSYQRSSTDISSLICKSIHEVIGFDRVWFCEFDEEGSGFVSGEYNNGVLPSLLHHRFPSTDVPKSIRSVYLKNKSRAILDSHASASLMVDADGNEIKAIDLTYSLARSPGGSHLEYLKNMSVRSSASFSVVSNGRLVGLFGAHSKSIALVRYRQLAICQYLVEKYLVKFNLLHNLEEHEAIKGKEEQIDHLVQRLIKDHFHMQPFIQQESDSLNELMNADGCLYFNGQRLYGNLRLRKAEQDKLIDLIYHGVKSTGCFSTKSLAAIDPYFLQVKNKLCGLLAISLRADDDEDDEDDEELLIWYREEHPHNEKWAGNPADAVLLDASGKVGPRQSFDSWVKSIEGQSTPWLQRELLVVNKFKYHYALKRALYNAKIQKQAAEKANADKSLFLANMSHELRTPLHTIIGFVESIMEKMDSMPKEKQMQYLGIAHQSSERLLSLINELLELSKMEAGMMTYIFAHDNFFKVIEDSIKDINQLIEKKHLKVSVLADSEINLVFDQHRMRQVMVNLLSNAAKLTPEGNKIDIKVQLDALFLHVEVSDQGIGIPDDELEAVFDTFVQSSKTKTGAGGTGLGLSICKEIIQAHNGDIWAKNNSDGGASFFVKIPRAIEEKTVTL